MITEIPFSGYTAIPSDYECADGTLAASTNLICEDSQLKPIPKPIPKQIGLTATQRIVYIHETSAFRHFILLDGVATSWTVEPAEGASPSEPHPLATFTGLEIRQFTSVGNTLIALCSDGMHYFLWRDGAYASLGTHMPECSLSFGLQGEMKRTDEFSITFSIKQEDIYDEFDDEQKASVTQQVLAKVNKFIYEESTSKGKFMFPFLVRYAYRLYDGSLTMHSAPVLMVCSTGVVPRVFWFNLTGSGSTYTAAKLRVVSPVHTLDYQCVSTTEENQALQDWSDIIKSVDVFVSAPIYTYDQNGECERFINGGTDLSAYSICKHTNQAASTDTYPLRYQRNDFGKLYAFSFTPSSLSTRPGGVLVTPSRSEDAVKEDIRGVANFYILDSIPIDKLSTAERTPLTVKEDYLQSLLNRERMTDDYDSHDKIIPSQAFPYNSRLNISGVSKQLFSGFRGDSLFCYSNGYVNYYSDASPTVSDVKFSVRALVYIKQDGRDIIVDGGYGFGCVGTNAPLLFFYYPNTNAYKAVLVRNYVFDSAVEVNLEPHDFLNGAFYFGGWEGPSGFDASIPSASPDSLRTIEAQNKVYTSEVNNPYYFPLLGINTVGTGRILGISTAAKALSQGQFGQFPLYAFTTEGVWALEVSSNGSYSARQPITRDVLLSGTQPLQMDSAVLFASSRGIMQLSGSVAACISEFVNSESPFDVTSLPYMERLHHMLGHEADTCFPIVPFSQFLAGCGMLYDYAHQRVIAYNPEFDYAYVYSLKSQQWGMIFSTIAQGVNSYPDALAVDRNGYLLNFSSGEFQPQAGLFVTRPLKLPAEGIGPNMHKTIDSAIIRGNFARGHVQAVLYGSRDLIHWHAVWSSKDHYLRYFRGTGYKFFRLACITSLSQRESVYGASISVSPRLTNQLR